MRYHDDPHYHPCTTEGCKNTTDCTLGHCSPSDTMPDGSQNYSQWLCIHCKDAQDLELRKQTHSRFNLQFRKMNFSPEIADFLDDIEKVCRKHNLMLDNWTATPEKYIGVQMQVVELNEFGMDSIMNAFDGTTVKI